MPEEKKEEVERADADAGKKLDNILSHLDSFHSKIDKLGQRVDAMEEDRRKDAEETIRYFGKEHSKKRGDEELPEAERVAADKKKKDSEEEKREYSEEEDKKQLARDKKSEEHEKEELKREEKKADREKEEHERKDASKRKDEDEEGRMDRERKDEEEERRKADADADLRAAIRRVERALPKQMTDADYAELAGIQAKADEVFHAFGASAPRPLNGEIAPAYRRRMASLLKEHSDRYKTVNVSSIADDALFNVVEEHIYTDAMGVALSPATAVPGQLRAISKMSGGHEFITYAGSPSDWMDPIAGPSRTYVTSIFTPNSGSAR